MSSAAKPSRCPSCGCPYLNASVEDYYCAELCGWSQPKKPRPKDERPLDRDGWPARWSDPTYLGDGPWGA